LVDCTLVVVVVVFVVVVDVVVVVSKFTLIKNKIKGKN
jgi:hypothetical protein